MTRFEEGATCEGMPGHTTCSIRHQGTRQYRCVEILAFINPLCAECWGMEPYMKKFIVEYQQYFTLRYIMTAKHTLRKSCCGHQQKSVAEEWNKFARLTGMCCNADVWIEDPPSPYSIALAIKSAEFQGIQAGNRFLRKIREQIFLKKKGLNDFTELLEVARLADLNLEEFSNDFHSNRPIKALQCDRKLADEFAISELPSFVFSTVNDKEEAIKVNGHYDYDVYVQILCDLLGMEPEPKPAPALNDYFKNEGCLTTREVSVIYDLPEDDALIELRKLQLKQIIKPVTIKNGTFWKYIAG